MFITFEGIDSSGKSTQAKLLHGYLSGKGFKIILVREPGGTVVSERIRKILLDEKCKPMDYLTEFLLFSASRCQLTEEVIRPFLKKGGIVICDRYYDSSTAYQGFAGKVDPDVINKVNKIATGNLDPDITFYIDISYNESIKRKKIRGNGDDRIERRKKNYYNKVISGYKQIAKSNKRVKIMNGTKPVEEIHKEIISLLNYKLKKLK